MLSSNNLFDGEPDTFWTVIARDGITVSSTHLAYGTTLQVTSHYENEVHIHSPVAGSFSLRDDTGLITAIQGGDSLLTKCLYQVVLPDGAVVRETEELGSDMVRTIPHGDVVEVLGRRTNSTGLLRLQIEGGFVSESLNPLAGVSGPIVVPLLLWKPLNFVVVLGAGAVVRKTIELSSAVVSNLPEGTELTVIDRSFSENPRNNHLLRLKLADNSGWVSYKINRPPPGDEEIVTMTGISTRTLAEIRDEIRENIVNPNRDFFDMLSKSLEGEDEERRESQMNCIICFSDVRSALLLHGETGHICCCMECADTLRRTNGVCPICRSPIERVVQFYWA